MVPERTLHLQRISSGPATFDKTPYLLICGGDKANQDADIKNAHDM